MPVRLGGSGSSSTEGYVEAFNVINGQWGGVCDTSFDLFDAHVVCSMLGFPTALSALANSDAAGLYGTAPSGSNFTLDNLNCNGKETSIFHCSLTGELAKPCEASQIAGVKCAKSKICPIL